jgi:hypothetical protein
MGIIVVAILVYTGAVLYQKESFHTCYHHVMPPRPSFIVLSALLRVTVGFILLLPSFLSTIPFLTSYYYH